MRNGMDAPVGPQRPPRSQGLGIDASSDPHPLWALLQVALGLAVLWGAVWGASLLNLRWHGPTLPGARAVAGVAVTRTDDPVAQSILAALAAGEIYTFDELQAAATTIAQIDQDADRTLSIDLLCGLLIGAGLLVFGHEVAGLFASRHVSLPVASLVGVLDDSGTFVPRPLSTPQLRTVSRKALTRLPWMREITPVTPLASAILEIYAGSPEWPAASEGQHGDVTLLHHALGVRARALALAGREGIPPALAELAALGHDLGKLTTLRTPLEAPRAPSDGQGLLSPRHSRMSVLILSTLPEWQALAQEDRDDLTIAIAFHHRPDQIPVNTGLRARALLGLLRQADGLTTMRETRRAAPADEVAPETTTTEADPEGNGGHASEALATGTASAVTILTLEGRVVQALERLIPVLRINTRPFDGRTDPDIGILLLLDRALRRALGPQLSLSDQQALALTPATTTHPPDPSAEPFPHPATQTIAAAFRTLGWLIEARDSHQGILWETRIGRLSWHDSWLLRLDAMPQALRERWGRSVWPIEILGPTWPVPGDAAPPSSAGADEGAITADLQAQPLEEAGEDRLTRESPVGPAPRDARGQVTPGHLLMLAATSAGLWFLQQPKQDRVTVACKPIAALQKWMAVEDSPKDQWGQMMNKAFTQLRENCPENIGKPASEMAEQANTETGKAVKHAMDQARTLANRQVETVIDAERLKIEGLGEARLLGITVPREQRTRAIAYLTDTVLGKRVSITMDKAKDPDQRPLILVTGGDGTLVNAQMVKYGIAKPWRRDGPWQSWGT